MEDYTDLSEEELRSILQERDTLINDLNDYIDREEALQKIQLEKQELVVRKRIYDEMQSELIALIELAATVDRTTYEKLMRRVDRIRMILGRKPSHA